MKEIKIMVVQAQTEAKKSAAKQPPQAEGGVALAEGEKKKKRKSKRLRNAHRLEKSFEKAVKHMGDGISKGAKHYSERREKSASKRKNGALKDYGKNLSKAMRKAAKGGNKAGRSLSKGTISLRPRSRDRKRVERAVKNMTRLFGVRL